MKKENWHRERFIDESLLDVIVSFFSEALGDGAVDHGRLELSEGLTLRLLRLLQLAQEFCLHALQLLRLALVIRNLALPCFHLGIGVSLHFNLFLENEILLLFVIEKKFLF